MRRGFQSLLCYSPDVHVAWRRGEILLSARESVSGGVASSVIEEVGLLDEGELPTKELMEGEVLMGERGLVSERGLIARELVNEEFPTSEKKTPTSEKKLPTNEKKLPTNDIELPINNTELPTNTNEPSTNTPSPIIQSLSPFISHSISFLQTEGLLATSANVTSDLLL